MSPFSRPWLDEPRRRCGPGRRCTLGSTVVFSLFLITVLPAASVRPLANALQPVPRTATFQQEGYIVWGATLHRSEDGTCHLFYERWPLPFGQWRTEAEIACATAPDPLGPYTFQRVIAGKRRDDAWDGVAAYNPTLLRSGGKFYLYYTGNNGSLRRTTDERGRTATQRIGVLVANRPEGPWQRFDHPLIDLSPDGLDSSFACNPSVLERPDGTFLLVYKCGDDTGRVWHLAAEGESPTGPFRKHLRRIFHLEGTRFPSEDPFIWYDQGTYRAVLKDVRGEFSGQRHSLIEFVSADGLDWHPADPIIASPPVIRWADGIEESVARLERPQIWFDRGRPAVLFAAVLRSPDVTFNVHIPLSIPKD